MATVTNVFAGIPSALPEEFVELLLAKPGLRIERIVSRGHRSPEGFWYDQPEGEWVLLVKGAARLRFEDGEVVEMSPGDGVNISAQRRHRVEWTDPEQDTVWLAVHYLDKNPILTDDTFPGYQQ